MEDWGTANKLNKQNRKLRENARHDYTQSYKFCSATEKVYDLDLVMHIQIINQILNKVS